MSLSAAVTSAESQFLVASESCHTVACRRGLAVSSLFLLSLLSTNPGKPDPSAASAEMQIPLDQQQMMCLIPLSALQFAVLVTGSAAGASTDKHGCILEIRG